MLVLAVRVADTGCRRVAGCVRGADWVLAPGAGTGCARSGDTPRCIVCKIGAAANAGAAQNFFLHAFAIWGLCWSNLLLFVILTQST